MTDDLVQRLRLWGEHGLTNTLSDLVEAADYIEALTADLRAAMNELNACKDALAQDGELLTIAYMDGSHRSTKAHRSRIAALEAENAAMRRIIHHYVDPCDTRQDDEAFVLAIARTEALKGTPNAPD